MDEILKIIWEHIPKDWAILLGVIYLLYIFVKFLKTGEEKTKFIAIINSLPFIILLALILSAFTLYKTGLIPITKKLPPDIMSVYVSEFYGTSPKAESEGKAIALRMKQSLKQKISGGAKIYLIETKEEYTIKNRTQAKEIGNKLGAHLVVWGQIIEAGDTIENQPNIEPIKKFKGNVLQNPQLLPMSYTVIESNSISFLKRKGNEIADVVITILGIAHFHNGEYEKSSRLLESVANKNCEIFNYILISYGLLDNNSLPKASLFLKTYENDINSCNSPEILSNLGSLYIRFNDFYRAMSSLTRAIKIDSNSVGPHLNLGLLYAGYFGRLEDARYHYEKVIQLNPKNSSVKQVAYANLGSINLKQSKYKEAIEFSQKALLLKGPKRVRAVALMTLATCYIDSLSDTTRAVKAFKKAIEEDSMQIYAYINLSVIYDKQGKYDFAKRIIKEGLSADFNFAPLHCEMGINNYRFGNFQEAIRNYKKAIELSPQYCESHAWLSIVYEKEGKFIEARDQRKLYDECKNRQNEEGFQRFIINKLFRK
jgi:tetratricopeptide (TPR) repeat protein